MHHDGPADNTCRPRGERQLAGRHHQRLGCLALGVRFERTLLQLTGQRRLLRLEKLLDQAGRPDGLSARTYIRRQAGMAALGLIAGAFFVQGAPSIDMHVMHGMRPQRQDEGENPFARPFSNEFETDGASTFIKIGTRTDKEPSLAAKLFPTG